LRRKRKPLDEVASLIPKVREPGEPPKPDIFSFDSFICDLCKGTVERSGLIQCGFCGRWICKSNCWSNEHLACLTCSGLIKIWKESTSNEPPETDSKSQLTEFASRIGEKGKQLLKAIGLGRPRGL